MVEPNYAAERSARVMCCGLAPDGGTYLRTDGATMHWLECEECWRIVSETSPEAAAAQWDAEVLDEE